MSRKNNLQKRKAAHQAEIEKEKMLRQKKEEKEKIKLQKASAGVGGVQNKGVEKKRRFKGIRIRRNLTVRGIKIKDSESKKKVKQILMAEQAMREMQVDDDDGVGPSSSSARSKTSHKQGIKVKRSTSKKVNVKVAVKSPARASGAMEID